MGTCRAEMGSGNAQHFFLMIWTSAHFCRIHLIAKTDFFKVNNDFFLRTTYELPVSYTYEEREVEEGGGGEGFNGFVVLYFNDWLASLCCCFTPHLLLLLLLLTLFPDTDTPLKSWRCKEITTGHRVRLQWTPKCTQKAAKNSYKCCCLCLHHHFYLRCCCCCWLPTPGWLDDETTDPTSSWWCARTIPTKFTLKMVAT